MRILEKILQGIGLERNEFTKDTKESYCRGTGSFEKENFLKFAHHV